MDILYVTNVHRISKELNELVSFKDVIMNILIDDFYINNILNIQCHCDMIIIIMSRAVSLTNDN